MHSPIPARKKKYTHKLHHKGIPAITVNLKNAAAARKASGGEVLARIASKFS